MCDCIPSFGLGSPFVFDRLGALQQVLAAAIGSTSALRILSRAADADDTAVLSPEPPCRALASLALRNAHVFRACEGLIRASLGTTLSRMERRTRTELIELIESALPFCTEKERASALFLAVCDASKANAQNVAPTFVFRTDASHSSRFADPRPLLSATIENNCHIHRNCYIRGHVLS
jgi:hypothetical protein